MSLKYTPTHINKVKLTWQKAPPFIHQRAIVIEFPLYDRCPNKCDHTAKNCEIYDPLNDVTIIKTLPNPVCPKEILQQILNHYLPNDLKKDIADQPDDIRCVPIIVFKGDFMIPQNFKFMQDIIKGINSLQIGLLVGAETFGSNDEKDLPKLLNEKIVDELVIKIGVYRDFSKESEQHMMSALNTLSQSIEALTEMTQKEWEEVPSPNLKRLGFQFLFDKNSDLRVFDEYLHAIFDAYVKTDGLDPEFIDTDGQSVIMGMFDIYFRGDGTEEKTIISQAYNKWMKILPQEWLFYLPVECKNGSKCIYYNS